MKQKDASNKNCTTVFQLAPVAPPHLLHRPYHRLCGGGELGGSGEGVVVARVSQVVSQVLNRALQSGDGSRRPVSDHAL